MGGGWEIRSVHRFRSEEGKRGRFEDGPSSLPPPQHPSRQISSSSQVLLQDGSRLRTCTPSRRRRRGTRNPTSMGRNAFVSFHLPSFSSENPRAHPSSSFLPSQSRWTSLDEGDYLPLLQSPLFELWKSCSLTDFNESDSSLW